MARRTSIVAIALLLGLVTGATAQPITGGGLQKVVHDSTLTGNGTNPSPIGLAKCPSPGQSFVWNGSAWACGSGGVTNSAGAGVMMVSDGTNAVGSKLHDNGSQFDFTNSGIPFRLMYVGSSTWDMTPMIVGNTDPAIVTLFGNAVTTTPSANSSLHFNIVPGTGGAGGVSLSPNGASWIDPDHFAEDAQGLLCIGWECGSGNAEFDVRDPGNSHSASRIVGNFIGGSHFDTTSGAIETFTLSAAAIDDRTGGSAALTHNAAILDSANADVNNALKTLRGDVHLNSTSGTTFAHGPFEPSLFTEIAPTICDTSITPTTLTSGSTVNNYDLSTTLPSACRIRLTTTTSATTIITGMVPPTSPNGKLWMIGNEGNGPIVFAYSSASSSSGNRFFEDGDGGRVFDEWALGFLYYDSNIAAWRLIGGRPLRNYTGGLAVTSITCDGTGAGADCNIGTNRCSDSAGEIETKTSSTTCTITFLNAFTEQPVCNVQSRNGTVVGWSDTTAHLIVTGTFATNDPISYQCTGIHGFQ